MSRSAHLLLWEPDLRSPIETTFRKECLSLLNETILVCFWEVLGLSLLLIGDVEVENTRPKWQTVVARLVYT
jgi:hypothetical protein